MKRVCLLLLLWGIGCGQPAKEPRTTLFEGMDRRTKLRLQSYMANGQRLYNTHCANCHQRDGRGLRSLMPPLRGADYLKRRKEVACLIKYGARGPMIVSGKKYDAFMPSHPSLRNIHIAELMSYVGNAWGNREGLVPVKEVDRYLDSCQTVSKW